MSRIPKRLLNRRSPPRVVSIAEGVGVRKSPPTNIPLKTQIQVEIKDISSPTEPIYVSLSEVQRLPHEFSTDLPLSLVTSVDSIDNQENMLRTHVPRRKSKSIDSGKSRIKSASSRVKMEIKKGIKDFCNQIDPHHIMMFYYKISCIYFGSEDYENCIIYLDKIISNKKLKMREDLLCFSRVLNIFAHYEAGFDYHLESHLRETYKFLIKMNDLHEVQKAMIRFVRGLGDIYPHELKTAFEALYEELRQYENDPYERRSFLYLDILSWLESKIKNEPIAKIISKKASSINRKERSSISPLSRDLR